MLPKQYSWGKYPPYPDQLCQQLEEAGFAKVKSKQLIPFESFWSFVGVKPS
jgi:hypothetical protein